jgi:hypothetical protein
LTYLEVGFALDCQFQVPGSGVTNLRNVSGQILLHSIGCSGPAISVVGPISSNPLTVLMWPYGQALKILKMLERIIELLSPIDCDITFAATDTDFPDLHISSYEF